MTKSTRHTVAELHEHLATVHDHEVAEGGQAPEVALALLTDVHESYPRPRLRECESWAAA